MLIQKIANDKKSKDTFYSIVKIILTVGVIINFWIFARFTVDDAFITWRYGKNLVLHGIWNYNPSSFDMTQAYTNPIYAFLSIIPAYLRVDTVLFFKIISLIIVFLFAFYYTRKVEQGIIILLVAFVLPQTMIHVFSGIETFLFIALLTMLLISIYEESLRWTIVASAFLFYTRPESWTLLLIVPLVYCNWQSINFVTAKSIKIFFILLLLLLPNLIISYFNFNNILPNTFFVKSSSVFSFGQLMKYGMTLLPLIMACKYIHLRKNIPIIFFFLFIIVQYSKSSLSMDYNLRFLYHVFFPIVLFVFYLMGKDNNSDIKIYDTETGKSISFKYKNMCKVVIFVLLIIFLRGESISSLAHISNYYYRALSSHADAGKVINDVKGKYNIRSISCGDAGMLAFHANVDSLDLLELGSAVLTHNGINEAYSLYSPALLFLHGSESEVRTGGIFEYVRDLSKYENIGKITWLKTYYLWVYSENGISELEELFKNSYNANFKGNREIILEHIFLPPWSQWHE